MEGQAKKGSKIALYVVIAIVIIAVLVVLGIFLLKGNKESGNSALKQETITAENYDEVVNKVQEELQGKDDSYYFIYATMYYIMQDTMATTEGEGEGEVVAEPDENAMYVSIYGKTVQQLIDDGKRLMEEDSVSFEEFKQQIDDISNSIE